MADDLGPILPQPGGEPALPEGDLMPSGEPSPSSGDIIAPTGPDVPATTPAGPDSPRPASDTGHRWNMPSSDGPGR
jgi:hypothetical protein